MALSTPDPAQPRIPLVTVRRLVRYVRALELLQNEGESTVASGRLAETVGVKASQLRKDLAYFGEFGTRGKGYEVGPLLASLSSILGLHHLVPSVLVGVGRIGTAFSHYLGPVARGFLILGLFDVRPELIGTELAGIPIYPLEQLTAFCQAHAIRLGIITVPAENAQTVADALVAGGVRALLNVAPVTLRHPPEVAVRNVDITVELRLLSYMLLTPEQTGHPAHAESE